MSRLLAFARVALPVGAFFTATMAHADSGLRDFCPTRPGFATPPCILDARHVVMELGLVDWRVDRQRGEKTDQIVAGALLLRYGLNGTSEIQLGLAGFGGLRRRDDHGVSRATGAGDMTLAWKRGMVDPAGDGLALAIQPFVSLPTGGAAFGAGDWGAGLLVPLSVPLVGGVSLSLAPEVDAAVDGDGAGRHVAFATVAGLDLALGRSLSAASELAVRRDEDPAGKTTSLLAGQSLAWQAAADWQLDIGLGEALDRAGPDNEVYFGISRRF